MSDTMTTAQLTDAAMRAEMQKLTGSGGDDGFVPASRAEVARHFYALGVAAAGAGSAPSDHDIAEAIRGQWPTLRNVTDERVCEAYGSYYAVIRRLSPRGGLDERAVRERERKAFEWGWEANPKNRHSEWSTEMCRQRDHLFPLIPPPPPASCRLSDGSEVTHETGGWMRRWRFDKPMSEGAPLSGRQSSDWLTLLGYPTDTGADFDALKAFVAANAKGER